MRCSGGRASHGASPLNSVLGGSREALPHMVNETRWLGPPVWACLYVSDYFLTIACARLYRAQDRIVFEGSYEITPIFQADVNALRRISPRFLAIPVGSTAYLVWRSHLSERWDRVSSRDPASGIRARDPVVRRSLHMSIHRDRSSVRSGRCRSLHGTIGESLSTRTAIRGVALEDRLTMR